jgi:hypothetical protein
MSNYNIETVNTQFINQQFIDKINAGMEKEAGMAMSAFVRQKLREEGFTRKILTPQTITSADLDRGLNDQPRVIVEKEPDSVAASISLSGNSEIRYFNGERYEVPFHKIESATFKKSKYELATYKTDIRQVLQDNSVKDIQKVEDVNFWAASKAISVAQSNELDYIATNINFGITSLMDLVALIVDRFQKPGKILIPYKLYLKLISRKASVIGDIAASDLFRGGDQTNFYGFELITTIKSDILTDTLPGDSVGVYAPEQYLGQFYALQEPTVFLKTEKDMVEFTTYESVGVGFGNVNGLATAKYDLEGTDPDAA